jgi:hypothetical protein
LYLAGQLAFGKVGPENRLRRNAQGPLQGKWIEKSGLHRHSFSALPIGGKLHHFETNIYYRLQTMAIEDAEGRGET